MICSRSLGLALLFSVTGCVGSEASEPLSNTDDGPAGAFTGDDCVRDSDCAPASASCCDGCPSYAVSVASGWAESCEDVTCPDDSGFVGTCGRETAACVANACTLVCTRRECDLTCALGFSVDSDGCVQCSCSQSGDSPPATELECVQDSDCERAPADCCGCEQGGADYAVPVGQSVDPADNTSCDEQPLCPGVNLCDPSLLPRCVANECVLVQQLGPGAEPGPSECGAVGLAPCPAGELCVINDAQGGIASDVGLGICWPM